MNLIKIFKEDYIVIDQYAYQRNIEFKSCVNTQLEQDIFKELSKRISDPIRNSVNFELGAVYFVNNQDEDEIMFKFNRMNIVFNTSQNVNEIIKEINNASKIAYI